MKLRSIWSLASPNHSGNGWGSCPLATTGNSISLHLPTPRSMKRGVDFGKHLLYFFYRTYPHSKDDNTSSERPVQQKGWPEDRWRFESFIEVNDDKIIGTDLLHSTTERNAAFWKWAFLQQVKRVLVLPPHTVKTRGGRSSRTLVLPSHTIKTGRGGPEITCHICRLHV